MALLRSQAPYIPKTVKLVWQATGMWMAAWLALLLVQGVLPVAIVYMTRQAVDSLVGVVKNSGAIGGIKAYDHLVSSRRSRGVAGRRAGPAHRRAVGPHRPG